MNQKGFSRIALIVGGLVVVAAGVGYWFWMQNPTMAISETQTLPSPSQIANTSNQPTTNPAPQAAQAVVRLELVGLTSKNQSLLPVLRYNIVGKVQGNPYINVVSKNSGKSVWGMEVTITSSTKTIDLNTLTAINGSAVKISDGDYFLRLQDFHSGAVLAESESFHVAPGVMGN